MQTETAIGITICRHLFVSDEARVQGHRTWNASSVRLGHVLAWAIELRVYSFHFLTPHSWTIMCDLLGIYAGWTWEMHAPSLLDGLKSWNKCKISLIHSRSIDIALSPPILNIFFGILGYSRKSKKLRVLYQMAFVVQLLQLIFDLIERVRLEGLSA